VTARRRWVTTFSDASALRATFDAQASSGRDVSAARAGSRRFAVCSLGRGVLAVLAGARRFGCVGSGECREEAGSREWNGAKLRRFALRRRSPTNTLRLPVPRGRDDHRGASHRRGGAHTISRRYGGELARPRSQRSSFRSLGSLTHRGRGARRRGERRGGRWRLRRAFGWRSVWGRHRRRASV